MALASAVFQKVMDTLLAGIPYVIGYTDDELVTGESDMVHLLHLEEVLKHLQSQGVRLKCQFFKDSVEYLGQL